MNKKYLITSGCSFTEGHNLGSKASWATHLAQELDLDLINLAKGGVGNEIITQSVINYATIRSAIAKDSFFVIQLSECMRYLINYDYDKKTMYWHITPHQFIKKTGFDTWKMTDEPWNQHIYDNRDALAPYFSNITFTLIKTYWNIINFVNFCEKNNYPYLIFDGINNHIPHKHKLNGKWYLDGSDVSKEFEINVTDDDYKTRYHAILYEDLIDYVKSLKHYYNDTTLQSFCNKRKNDDYHKGNGGHPNELGSKMWAKHLVKIIGENNKIKVGRIHSFGCSFTAGHDGNVDIGEEGVSKRETYIEHLRELFIEKSLLNKSASREDHLFQYAHTGTGNHHIFRNVMSRLDQFKENDIVIIQWTSPYRYELPHKEDDVYFSLPYNNWVVYPDTFKSPEDANPNFFNEIFKIKDYKKSTESVILNHMNEKWLREMSYHFQYALYNTLESLKIKHIQLFGWNECSNALILKEKFLNKCFLPLEEYKKDNNIAPGAPRHPNKREHREMAVKLYDSLKKLYNI